MDGISAATTASGDGRRAPGAAAEPATGALRWVWLLLFVSVLLGVIKAFQMPAQQALAPALVPPAVLPRALAFSSMGSQAAIVAGPALGGFIYVAGAQAVYLTCGLLFALAGALINGVRYDHAPAPRRDMNWATLMAGFTTCRDMGPTWPYVDVALRDAIAAGAVPGPRLLVAGNYVSSTGGAGDARQFSIYLDVPISLPPMFAAKL